MDPESRSIASALIRFLERISLREIFRGLLLTLRHLFRPTVTRQYPTEKRDPFPGARSLHALARDPDTGEEKCVGCGLCAAICPSGCIRIHTSEDHAHLKVLDRYEIDTLKCLYCGLCVEACPYGAIVMTGHFAYSGYSRDGFQYAKDRLLDNWDTHLGQEEGLLYLERYWKPRLKDFMGADPGPARREEQE